MRYPFCALALLIPLPAFGGVLTSDASFGPGTIIESFEAIAGQGNDQPIGAPFTFPSGAKLLSPPPHSDSSSLYIVNGGFFGLEGGSALIPDGTAYLGQAGPGLFDSGVIIDLPFTAYRVGAYVATSQDGVEGPVLVEAISPGGAVIDSVTTRNVTSSGWRNNFIGFQSEGGIRKIHYDGLGGGVLRVDKLQVEPLPEPSSVALVAVAGAGLVTRRKRQSDADRTY